MKKFLPYSLIAKATLIATATPIIIVILGFFIYFSKTIFQKGYIYHTDVTEGLSVQSLPDRYLYTYSNDLGESLAEKARIPLFYLVYGTFQGLKLFGFDDSFYVKIKIFLLVILTLSGYIYYTKKLLNFLNEKATTKKETAALVAATVGGLYYVVNYWFTNRIVHFGLFFSTLTVPITFYYAYTYLFSEKTDFKKLALLTIFLSILTPTPHTLFFIFLILFCTYISFITSKKPNKSTKITRTAQLTLFGILFTLISSIWTLPFIFSKSKPDPVLSETIVNIIGREANLNNSIRLMGYWLADKTDYFYKPLENIQTALSYLPLALAIAAIIVFRKKLGLGAILIGLLFLGVFLATSFKPADVFYFWLMFKSPIKGIGWLFREYDKLGLMISYVYALSISLLIYRFFHKKILLGSLLILVTALISSNLYFFDKTISNRYTPVAIPTDFEKVVSFLEKDPEEANSVWYPPVLQPYWAKNEEVRYVFANLISPKPAFTTRSETINYLDYLFDPENIYGINMSKALDLVGVKYLIIRNDDNPLQPSDLNEKLNLQEGMEKVFSTTFLTVYKNNDFSGLAKIYTSKLLSNQGLSTLKELDSLGIEAGKDFVDYTDKPSKIEGIATAYLAQNNEVTDMAINKFEDKFIYPFNFVTTKDDGNPGFWTLGSLENKTHAETNFFFKDLGLEISQFDYSKGVIIAREGWEKINANQKPTKIFKISFSQYPNLQITDSGMKDSGLKPRVTSFLSGKVPASEIKYAAVEKDLQGFWNTERSDKFRVQGIKGLQVTANSEISKDLVPHFKIYFYDEGGKVIDIKFIYADQRGAVSSIVKLPDGAKTADFSIWTLSNNEKPYEYKISKLEIGDISNNVRPISFGFKTKSNCTGECTVLARVLKSQIGGSLGITLNNENFLIDTTLSQELYHPERYTWIELGKISGAEDVQIGLRNLKGFNSVNAVVLLSNSEYQAMQNEIGKISANKGTVEETPAVYKPQIKKINPTEYSITVLQNINKPVVVAFAKPYSDNWELIYNGKPMKPVVINGYINGWYFESLKSGTYFVEYRPQKYFLIGAGISGVVLLGLGIYLAAAKRSLDSN